jgi:hypothetical protein
MSFFEIAADLFPDILADLTGGLVAALLLPAGEGG